MKRTFLPIIALLCFFACEKETININNEPVAENDAAEFYDNLNVIVNSAYIGKDLSPAAMSNSIYDKLSGLSIIDADGKRISFFDMPAEEQSELFKQYAELESESLAEKMESIPYAREYYKAQNEIVNEILGKHAIETKSDGSREITDVDSFLEELESNILSFSLENHPFLLSPMTKTQAVNDTTYIKNTLANVAKRGDIIVCLPFHDAALIPLNLINGESTVGHCEVFATDITPSVMMNDLVTVGAQSWGLNRRSLYSEWMRQSYVLGIKIYDYKWERLRLRPVERKINPADLATKAETYLGLDYVTDAEFLVAKLAAPERFTCATLIWWCARELWDIELAPWLSPLVLPSDIYLSEYTYLKTSID